MGKIISFTVLSLNGYYKDENNGIAWHKHGEEELKYSRESLKFDNTLVFGRITYEEMASFWPTPMGEQADAIIAKGMNDSDKIVISKSLKRAEWKHTKIIGDNVIQRIKKIKKESQNDFTILGSGQIVSLLSEHTLIDEYQIMIDPVVIGKGSTLFANLTHKVELVLKKSTQFKSGVLLVYYKPKYI